MLGWTATGGDSRLIGMFYPKALPSTLTKDGGKMDGLVAVAIDKDKGSQHALKWAVENLCQKGQPILLIHVKTKSSSSAPQSILGLRVNQVWDEGMNDQQTRDIFLPFRCFCTRKDIQCKDILLEEPDIVRAISQYVNLAGIDNLVVGAPPKPGFLRRFKDKDIPGNLSKAVPDFCNVYVIYKGKISSMRSASRPAPAVSLLHQQLINQPNSSLDQQSLSSTPSRRAERSPVNPTRKSVDESGMFRSPFTRKGYDPKIYEEMASQDTDISFVSSGRPSIDHMFPSYYDAIDVGKSPRMSSVSDTDYRSYELPSAGRMSTDVNSSMDLSSAFPVKEGHSYTSQAAEDLEAEMRRLKLELKQTMDMFSTACKEALSAKQKAVELQRWKMEEEKRLEEAHLAEEAAMAVVAKERAKSRAAIEHAEAAQRIAELEAQKRISAEMKALRESEEKKKVLNALAQSDVRYRRYTIEEIEAATEFFNASRKIGEGGYGPVYKCHLDHTPVAIKVLRPDAAHGRSQFQQEVEVLSCIRHPNMVLLLGACPEYGCLVYEYMANGSLEDCLFRRRNKPPLSWRARFRIAAEIGTGLLFLHHTKPEPLVHRDLKPANILLDRNYVSKISDVGLARLVPQSVADTVTQYRMTSAAGTFCYIDPEYQQTGMLGIKSDVYSLGIMLLQIVTGKPPMGLAHHVGKAVEKGTFADMLDPAVTDWPVEEALSFAKVAFQCAELRRKDRPDLSKVVLPELNRLRALAEEGMLETQDGGGAYSVSSSHSLCQELLSGPQTPSEASSATIASNP
uniref:RING-type E3 ubiquitin transferase n=1 Tax=Kalanchoe fedtschenkoi TaxID=63787 RepID=A0A7N0URN2_KALFE